MVPDGMAVVPTMPGREKTTVVDPLQGFAAHDRARYDLCCASVQVGAGGLVDREEIAKPAHLEVLLRVLARCGGDQMEDRTIARDPGQVGACNHAGNHVALNLYPTTGLENWQLAPLSAGSAKR